MKREIFKKILQILFFSFLMTVFSARAEKFYFESPVELTEKNTQFPVVLSGADQSYLFFERNNNSLLTIEMMMRKGNSLEWTDCKKIAGPFPYSGEVPDIYTAAILDKGVIGVAVTLSEYEIGVYCSSDEGKSFSFTRLSSPLEKVVAPRIYKTSSDGFVLFASMGTENKFSIGYATSSDGTNWSSITQFAPAAELDNTFSPCLCPVNGGDLVVFQSHFAVPGRAKTFQIYSSFSSDGLKTFLPAVLLTDDSTTDTRKLNSFVEFSNQNPVIFADGKSIYCAWERNQAKSENSFICLTEINSSGILAGRKRVREYSGQKKSHRPYFFSYKGASYLLWFDGNSGAYSVELNGDIHTKRGDETPVKNGAKASFIYPVYSKNNSILSYIWQDNGKTPKLYISNPDTWAPKPSLSAVNFKEGKRATSEKIKLNIKIPADTNDIAAYAWSFSQNEADEPSIKEEDILYARDMTAGKNIPVTLSAYEDGEYYFKARVLDYAGNWSSDAVIKYYRDITPPQKPVFSDLMEKFMAEFSPYGLELSWDSTPDDIDVAGYSWTLTKVEDLSRKYNDSPNHPLNISGSEVDKLFNDIDQRREKILKKGKNPPRSILTSVNKQTFSNLKNGIYVFSLRAIDEVGNAGESDSIIFVYNKYKPATVISGLNTKKDEYGNLVISVYGQDFDYEGTVKEIYIDADGKAPYDKVFYLNKGDYKVESSRVISGIHVSELDIGTYGVYLNHSERGISPSRSNLTSNKFVIDESGTIKIEHPYTLIPEWTVYESEKTSVIQVIDILMLFLVMLSIIVAVFSVRGIIKTARESVLIQSEVIALFNGDIMPLEKQKKMKKIKTRQTSLRLKLIGFTALLVLTIVLMVSISLGTRMIKTQRLTLVQSMEEQVIVLLEGMANSVQNAMNDAINGEGTLGLIDIVRQADTFKPAEYATLIGRPASSSNAGIDYFWASTLTGEKLTDILDTEQPLTGRSRFIEDSTEAQIAKICSDLELEAHKQVDSILAEIAEKYSIEKKNEYTEILRALSRTNTKAVPDFNAETLNSDNLYYTFYYPVFYKNSASSELLHGVLIIKVSAADLIEQVEAARVAIIVISAIIAIIAIIIGGIGSFIVASLIVEPIKKLVEHVKVITETKDKKQLKDFEIELKSRDEIGTLGQAVNDMTAGLVKAAEDEEKALEQEKMALDGKAVQQTFLPLIQNNAGGKETTARLKENAVQIFGYYEGADAVSGDYFDYKKLDDRFYAIIKCDVSGHGVPAALMMTVVATLFRKYFENWSIKTHGTSLDKLVVQINDFIESLGVKGKFATLMVCLFDTKTGDVYMCNAGDNIIHIFDQASQSEKVVTLHKAPASGMFPSFMVDMKGGFKVEKIHLNKGDVLFLYTDGIEEATRFFRNSSFEVINCAEPGLNDGDEHENHKVGQNTEQMEPERVKGILEAVLNRQVYKLVKFHSPNPSEELIFDFTKLEGNIDEAIMSLAAVEKVFRMYKTPAASGTVSLNEKGDVSLQGDVIRIDRQIDVYLKKTFNLYDYYCSGMVDMNEPNYVYYTGVNEDPQADDLTLLAVRKM